MNSTPLSRAKNNTQNSLIRDGCNIVNKALELIEANHFLLGPSSNNGSQVGLIVAGPPDDIKYTRQI